jgi:hypothetical protein
MQVDMQNMSSALEETTCVRTYSSCRLGLQKIDGLEVSLGDIKNVSFYTMIYLCKTHAI